MPAVVKHPKRNDDTAITAQKYSAGASFAPIAARWNERRCFLCTVA
ncbi:hypothetical protein PF003_g38290 [Phytophthora fragariae]|nr:hypothetical protein PF003_g38290 [Phytophthora fragariae]